ncbi:hypothetical protein PENTCL1PPCAC_14069, partial [Pristionchus entomophagus]
DDLANGYMGDGELKEELPPPPLNVLTETEKGKLKIMAELELHCSAVDEEDGEGDETQSKIRRLPGGASSASPPLLLPVSPKRRSVVADNSDDPPMLEAVDHVGLELRVGRPKRSESAVLEQKVKRQFIKKKDRE